MRRRAFLLLAGALVAPVRGNAQSSGAPRIGVILHSASYGAALDGLRAGLKEHGVIEGRDVILELADAKGDPKAVEDAARRFERERVRLIYAVPTSAASVVKRVTKEVPIFFCVGSDPIAGGLVESFAKPGSRITGVHYMTTDLTAKRLELLKELLPKLRSVLILYNPAHGPALASMKAARPASARLGIRLVEREVRSLPEIRAAVAALKAGDADALFMIADAAVTSQSDDIIRVTKAVRIPVIGFDETMVERGALVSYGVDLRETGRQSAKNVQRLLAGARAADLPVENVTRLGFVLNRRTAREMGIAVPAAMLVRFDRVIE